MVEVLVTISIVAILAAMTMGVLHSAKQIAAEAATKATIVKLNAIIMRKYEGYVNRRVPVNLSGLKPAQAREDRLYAIRDMMRMEMPDRQPDVDLGPIQLPNSHQHVPLPAVTRVYQNRLAKAKPGNGSALGDLSAELLYMIVTVGTPEALQQFGQSEIGDINENGLPEFLDGWGRPIAFLRWAPGFTPYSGIQLREATVATGDPQVKYHDPFDPFGVDPPAYQLMPLIYSAGSDGKLGLRVNGPTSSSGYAFAHDNPPVNESGKSENMFTAASFLTMGEPMHDNPADTSPSTEHMDNITNHHIEAR